MARNTQVAADLHAPPVTQLLAQFGIEILSHVIAVGNVHIKGTPTWQQIKQACSQEDITFNCTEPDAEVAMKKAVDDILRTVSKHYGVNRGDLLSGRRNRSIVRPRQIGMYLAKLLTSRSLPEIGRRFGNRDHTTVLHAIRKIEQLMNDDTQLREEVELLKRLLRE